MIGDGWREFYCVFFIFGLNGELECFFFQLNNILKIMELFDISNYLIVIYYYLFFG